MKQRGWKVCSDRMPGRPCYTMHKHQCRAARGLPPPHRVLIPSPGPQWDGRPRATMHEAEPQIHPPLLSLHPSPLEQTPGMRLMHSRARLVLATLVCAETGEEQRTLLLTQWCWERPHSCLTKNIQKPPRMLTFLPKTACWWSGRPIHKETAPWQQPGWKNSSPESSA